MKPSAILPTRIWLAAVLAGTVGCAPVRDGIAGGPTPDRAEYRVYEVDAARFVPLAELATDLEEMDVVFFGEFHDDPVTHHAQRDLLEMLAQGDRPVVLGLEMFERTVQEEIDRYLRGESDEAAFLAAARPWPNYSTDYRPLVEIARAEGWRVVGTNLPQTLATGIARGGLSYLEGLPAEERRGAAARIECAGGEYWDRFIEAIGAAEDSAATAAHTDADPMLRSMFDAQCARDETMAETLAPFVGDGALIVHVNGAFHTDHALGIVPRLLRREPEARVAVVTAVPVEGLADPPLEENRERADFLIFTPEPPS